MQTVNFKLTVGGVGWGSEITRRASVTLMDKRGFEADELQITLANHDGRLTIPTRGAQVTFAISVEDQYTDKGAFTVQGVEYSGPPDTIRITAYSADFRASLLEQRSQSYPRGALEGLVNLIAGRHELAPAVATSLVQTELPHLDQTNESDANLMTRLARDLDALFSIKNGRLMLLPLSTGKTRSGRGLPATTLTRRELAQYRFADVYSELTGVKARWLNRSWGLVETVIAGNDTGPTRTLPDQYRDAATAERAASAALARFKRGLGTFTGTLKTCHPTLIPETPLKASGFGRYDRVAWITTEVTHRVESGGAGTAFRAETVASKL